ncbi:MAG: hypothetical protein LBQ93_01615 [Treponema sp.]|jgi:hypothetical protein|nr:hypothetical protein [Treponema sp.]
MPDKKPEVLKIFRQLSPKHRADLLTWVRLAYTAENSVKKSFGLDVMADSVSSLKPWEYSCENLIKE